MSSSESTPATAGRFSRLRAATDRVPTKWFAAILTGGFLIATAAFGGLADAAEPPVQTVAVGAEHPSAQLTIEVEDVVLMDDLTEFSLELEPGQRALVVLAHVTNEWTEPQIATHTGTGLANTVRVVGVTDDAAPLAIGRVDDPLLSPLLQPGLRVPLAFIWSVPSSQFRDGDPVTVQLFDESLVTGSVVTAGQWWDNAVLAATVTTTATDLGTGAAP